MIQASVLTSSRRSAGSSILEAASKLTLLTIMLVADAEDFYFFLHDKIVNHQPIHREIAQT